MKTIKLIFKYNEKSKLLSIETTHTCLRREITSNNRDNKLIVENLIEASSLIGFIIDKSIEHVSTKETSDGTIYYHELELPLSDCGKYMLIKNPFPG